MLRTLRLLTLLALGLTAACERAKMDLPAGAVPPEEIVAETRELTDDTRSTPKNRSFSGAASRHLTTQVWFAAKPPEKVPACRGGRCRLVVLAHRRGGGPDRISLLARALARAGYVVAAPRFPLTSESAPGGSRGSEGDLLEQPRDVSFVIDALLSASRDPSDPLHGRIAPPPVGLIGHSWGGTTAIAATRLSCCRDPRIGAVVLAAPSLADVGRFEEAISGSGPTTLVLHGQSDDVVPIDGSRRLYASIAPPRYLVELQGAAHSDFIEDPGRDLPYLGVSAHVVVSFFDAALGRRPRNFRAILKALPELGHVAHAHRG